MERLINNPRRLLVMGATLAMAALVVTLLAASFASSPALADVPVPGGNNQPTPEACNPNPDDVVVRGSVALFDVYWDPEAETLNNNPCPPTVMHTDYIDEDSGETKERTTRMPSDVDIGHTIVHLRHDVARRTLVAEGHDMEGEDGYLAVDPKSPLLAAYPSDEQNKQVWFLPIFASEEEEHAHRDELAFHLGFSAGLMRDADWEGDIQYDFEVIREPQVAPGDRGVIMVSENVSFTEDAIDWNTRDPDKKPISVAPGEYEHRAWAFTRPGTYVLSVQARARPVSGLGDDTNVEGVTSKAREYTFHVGDLTLDEQPMFHVERAVAENSPSGTLVGAPLAMMGIGGGALNYSLVGEGSNNFVVNTVDGGAQISVADGANLDFETRSTYKLRLSVSDGKMITGAPDPSVDSVIAVRVNLTDDLSDNPALAISIDTTTPAVGSAATLTATLLNLPEDATNLRYTWAEHDVAGDGLWTSIGNAAPTWKASHDTAGLRRYSATVGFDDAQGNRVILQSELLDVTWVSP